MGLREDVQADVAAAFDDDLADAVRAFTLTRATRTVTDRYRGTSEEATAAFDSRGVFGRFNAEEVDNQHILATDEKLTVLQNELGTEPAVGDQIAGRRVMGVGQDPAGAIWTLQLRSA